MEGEFYELQKDFSTHCSNRYGGYIAGFGITAH